MTLGSGVRASLDPLDFSGECPWVRHLRGLAYDWLNSKIHACVNCCPDITESVEKHQPMNESINQSVIEPINQSINQLITINKSK